jgi:hypothetical protein
MRNVRHLLLASSLAWGGCAIGPGGPFASVDGTIASSYAVSLDRVLPDGWARLASDYQVRIDSATVGVVDAELRARAGGGGGGGTFDPANPPPGFSLCHGGHCHRDDGALIPFEEIQADLAAGGAPTVTTLVRFPVSAQLDALLDAERTLECEGSCDLPLTTITESRAGVNLLFVQGAVRDSRASSRLVGEVPFQLSADAAVLRTSTQIPSDRSHPPHIILRIRVELRPEHFDEVDWAVLDRSAGTIELSLAANPNALDQIVDAFSASGLATDVVRRTE